MNRKWDWKIFLITIGIGFIVMSLLYIIFRDHAPETPIAYVGVYKGWINAPPDNNFKTSVKVWVIEVDGCEYVVLTDDRANSIVHKENCKNHAQL